jgi:signal transduction histidine kinase
MTTAWREQIEELTHNFELRERQLLLAQEIDRRILDSTPLADTLRFIVEQTREALRARHVDILFIYRNGLRIELSSDPEEEKRLIPVERSISGLALERDEPVLENNVLGNEVLRERYFPRISPSDVDEVPMLSVLTARITLEGNPIGAINVEAAEADRYGPAHVEFVRTVSTQISVAITHGTLFDEDKLRRATDLMLLRDSAGDSENVMRQVLTEILTTLRSFAFIDVEAAEVLFVDPHDPNYLSVAYSSNAADIGVRVAVAESVCGEAFKSRNVIVLDRARDHPHYRPLQNGMNCEMAIPINLGGVQGFSIGVLNIESAAENAFSRVAQALAERFAHRVVNVLAMTKLRNDLDSAVQDQLLILAADQVLNAVHMINNHVGAARALADDLLIDLELGDPARIPELRERLERIKGEADRALAIPGELRRRIVAPQDSAKVNEQIRVGLERLAVPRPVEVRTDLADGLPDIPCTALDLVVENLAMNALEAMAGESGVLSVSSSLDEHSEGHAFVVVKVADTGKGMNQHQLDQLFEPHRATARGRGRGLGFGMVWVRAWVRRAHGLIHVDSAEGVGTTVTLRFQIDPDTRGALISQGGD